MKSLKHYNLCVSEHQCEDCNEKANCERWSEFVKLHLKTKKYAHFDRRVSLGMDSIRRYVMDSQKIETHGFFPFIHFTKKSSTMKKGNRIEKVRELYYCCHLDRCVFQRYAYLVNSLYNDEAKRLGINHVAIAYRDNLKKNNVDFAKDAFDSIRGHKNCKIIVGDFSNFFDNLDHQYLKKQLCDLLGVDRLPKDYYAIYKNITHFSSIDWQYIVAASGHTISEKGIRFRLNGQNAILTKQQFNEAKKNIVKHRDKGIPQGSPISAILSNLYMKDFDATVQAYVKKNDGTYMRYSDDFLILFPNTEDRFDEHKEWIFEQLNQVPGLRLQTDKTHIYVYQNGNIHCEDGGKNEIDYLGFIFDGKGIRMRTRSITKYYYRMHRKARTVGRMNAMSLDGNRISAKNLYEIYSTNKRKGSQTFIDYARNAKAKLQLQDHDLNCLIKNYKHKIHMAIKKASEKESE